MNAYLAGLEAAKEAGHDLSKIHSVASFFVSRVDTEIDDRLEKIGTEEALALRGQAGNSGFGLVQSGALEASNVDITEQLVNMITAQRNFQANAQMISTADAITQTIINIR